MRKRIDHCCSVVPEKYHPSCPPFSGKLGKPRFPMERWALGWDFSVPTEHQWWILFISHTCTSLLERYKMNSPMSAPCWLHFDLWHQCNVKITTQCLISVYLGSSGSLFHVFMPPKELWEAYSNRTVRPSVSPSVPLSCPVHISYILWGRNSKFGVWIHLGMAECRVPFLGHCDLNLDLWPSF